MRLDLFHGLGAVSQGDRHGVARAKAIGFAAEREIAVGNRDRDDDVGRVPRSRRQERDVSHEWHWGATCEETELAIQLYAVEFRTRHRDWCGTGRPRRSPGGGRSRLRRAPAPTACGQKEKERQWGHRSGPKEQLSHHHTRLRETDCLVHYPTLATALPFACQRS